MHQKAKQTNFQLIFHSRVMLRHPIFQPLQHQSQPNIIVASKDCLQNHTLKVDMENSQGWIITKSKLKRTKPSILEGLF
jgi:hypothetical protein